MMLLRMQKLQHTYSLLLLKRQVWTCRNGCSASRNLSVSQIFPTKFPKTAIQRVFFTAKFWFSQVPFKYHNGLAADMAAKIGCTVDDGVNRKTTILVVGDQDIKKLAGHEKSSKHRKAEKLIAEGCQIRIHQESDFKELVLLAERK